MRLSIVVPTHDTRALVLACLDSIARHARDAHETIVVDDGSGDGTAEAIAKAYPAVRVLRSERATGFAAAANRGLTSAAGEILLLLNSDAELEAETLPAMRRAFAARPRLGAAGGALRDPDGSPQWSGGRWPTPLWLFVLGTGAAEALGRSRRYRRGRSAGAVSRADWVSGAALAIRAEAWRRVGPLDEGFRFYGQDVDYCRRLRDGGWEVALLGDAPVRHHGGGTVGARPDAVGRGYQAEWLWSDLVRWVAKHEGPSAAAVAARALRAGALLRLGARSLAGALRPAHARAAWERESSALRAARRALRDSPHPRTTH